jgi:hypothetical protein
VEDKEQTQHWAGRLLRLLMADTLLNQGARHGSGCIKMWTGSSGLGPYAEAEAPCLSWLPWLPELRQLMSSCSCRSLMSMFPVLSLDFTSS